MGRIAKQIGTSAAAAAFLAVAFAFPVRAQADFGIASFAVSATNQDGSAEPLAGSHPFAYTFEFALRTDSAGQPEGQLRGLDVDLPPGLIGNPRAIPRCARSEFEGGTPACSPRTQVGVLSATATDLGSDVIAPVYNLVPPPGYAASFGLAVQGNTAIEGLRLVGSGPDAHLRVTTLLLPTGLGIKRVTQTLWGVPADSGHDEERAPCLGVGGTCPAEAAPAPLLTLPTSCGTPLTTTLGIRSLEEPDRTVTARTTTGGGDGGQGLRDCAAVPFSPRLALGTNGAALAPTGLQFDLELPASELAFGRAAATVDRLSLELPPGLTLNPATAAGLDACSPAQIGLSSAPGEAARFDTASPACPEASKLGVAEGESPVLDHPLRGSVYLAAPGENPFGTPFAIYVVLDDPDTGTLIKLPGRLDADPGDGRITATVDRIPSLPLSRMRVEFWGGPRGRLVTPPDCGTFATTADVVPSSAPGGATAHLRSSFSLDHGGAFASCPAGPRPNQPTLEAGSAEAVAGAEAPLVLRLRRDDASQLLAGFALTLPSGLSAKLAGVAVCGGAAAPACPASSAVGQATVGAGVGSAPLWLGGTVYLGGPYRGAPASLMVVVPALAGPFDLGTVVVRVAVRVDPENGQLSAASDPFPQILDGVPLAIRSLALSLDRPGFIRNPTSCEPMTIAGTAVSTLGQSSAHSNPFQVGDCAALGLRPRLDLRLAGGAHRTAHPSLRAVLRPRAGDANLRRVTLTLPRGVLLDSRRIHGICARDTYARGACPARAAYGEAKVWSPLLDRPLSGPVYLRNSNGRLPDLVASLDGEVHLDLAAHLGSRRGRIQVGFGSIPDLPLSKVSIRLAGGRQGLLAMTSSLCRHRGVRVGMTGQNGRLRKESIRLRARCRASRQH